MQLKQLFTDEDGVSPVIGVILMVAITVILAAVIASFVLGLGDTADEVQPNSNFAFDWDGDDLTITLTDGESIEVDEIAIRGEGVNEAKEGGEISGLTSGEDWSVGESITLNGTATTSDPHLDGDEGDDVNVVWEESGGDSAATLATFASCPLS